MNEEIKEILDFLKDENEYYKEEEQVVVNYGDLIVEKEDIDKLLNYITNLQQENKLHSKILKDANEILNIQAQKGNYNYDSYMLGLYNGMEMIVALFEQRKPKFIDGHDIEFIEDYKSRNEKAIEKLDKYINTCETEAKHTLNNEKCLISINHSKKIKSILQGSDRND